jgi:hypothetical protein
MCELTLERTVTIEMVETVELDILRLDVLDVLVEVLVAETVILQCMRY